MSRAAILAALIALSAAPAFAQAAYFTQIEDVPLAPGFTEMFGRPVFDAEAGRIVFASAEGRASAAQVRAFYDETLPQLGWAFSPGEEGALVFQRGRETLNLTIREGAQRTRLSVQLVTQLAATNAD